MEIPDRLKGLIGRSKELVKAIRKKDSDLTPLLAEQYNDPSHFVYEILQNSEDAGAKYVNFELHRNGIRISHDGRGLNFKT